MMSYFKSMWADLKTILIAIVGLLGIAVFGIFQVLDVLGPKTIFPEEKQEKVEKKQDFALNVYANWDKHSIDEMEAQITEVLEQSLKGMLGVTDLSSMTENGISRVTISFSPDISEQEAQLTVQHELDALVEKLPKDAKLRVEGYAE